MERRQARMLLAIGGRPGGKQLGDDLAPVSYLDVRTGPHQAHILAQPVLQLSKAHGAGRDDGHGRNVAS
jgi:hypothetical protein